MNKDFSNKIGCLNANNRNTDENGMIARRLTSGGGFSTEIDEIRRIRDYNAIRFQRDSCKFQEDFQENISCDGADARKSGRRRIIR